MQTEILTTVAEIATDTVTDTVTESEIVSTANQPTVRLSKRLADLGFCSRREADVWIERGWVQVDGVTVDVLGSKVTQKQTVTVQRAATFAQSQAVTILINKPVGYVSGQAENDYTPASALIHPNTRWEGCTNPMRFEHGHLRGLAPAGRLDIDSVGLLVLTQDGRVARTLIGEDSGIEKEYLVRVRLVDAQSLSDEGLALLNFGLSLDGKALKPAQVTWLNEDQLRFVLREGKKRQIRRMCELVGLRVTGLKRVRIGNVMLGHLPEGSWRYLNRDESFDAGVNAARPAKPRLAPATQRSPRDYSPETRVDRHRGRG